MLIESISRCCFLISKLFKESAGWRCVLWQMCMLEEKEKEAEEYGLF